MATPASPNLPPVTPSPAAARLRSEPEIVVMPDKFYGVALKMRADELPPQPVTPPPVVQPTRPHPSLPPPPPTAPRRSVLPTVLLIGGAIAILAGGFVYFNRDLLFRRPAATPTPTPTVEAPAAPANVSANVASGTTVVVLAWTDTAGNETGFRLERREGEGAFQSLTSAPANSTAFQDATARPEIRYGYRVLAVNAGGESAPSNEATVDVPALPPPTPAAPALPPGGLDSDSDGLSDIEEPLYGTDRQAPDADQDKFLDGNEVFHLYNPAAQAPVRLIDSGLVKPFRSDVGWSLYVPQAWQATLDGSGGGTAATGRGEQFFITLDDNASALPLVDWYVAKYPGTTVSSLRPITTKGGLEGVFAPDRMTAYFAWDGKIFSLRYDIDGQTYVNYRTTYEMMLNSLALDGAPRIANSAESIEVQGPGTLLESTSSTPAP